MEYNEPKGVCTDKPNGAQRDNGSWYVLAEWSTTGQRKFLRTGGMEHNEPRGIVTDQRNGAQRAKGNYPENTAAYIKQWSILARGQRLCYNST